MAKGSLTADIKKETEEILKKIMVEWFGGASFSDQETLNVRILLIKRRVEHHTKVSDQPRNGVSSVELLVCGVYVYTDATHI